MPLITGSMHRVSSQIDRYRSMHAAEKCTIHRSESVLKENGHEAVILNILVAWPSLVSILRNTHTGQESGLHLIYTCSRVSETGS